MKPARTLIAIFALSIIACAGTQHLNTSELTGSMPSGTCNLILYSSFTGDVELRLAVLDLTGDGYTFSPRAPKAFYKTTEGLTVEEALARSRSFLEKTQWYSSTETRQILDPEGKVIALEMRPLYETLSHGLRNIIETSYFIKTKGLVLFMVREFEVPRPLLLKRKLRP